MSLLRTYVRTSCLLAQREESLFAILFDICGDDHIVIAIFHFLFFLFILLGIICGRFVSHGERFALSKYSCLDQVRAGWLFKTILYERSCLG